MRSTVGPAPVAATSISLEDPSYRGKSQKNEGGCRYICKSRKINIYVRQKKGSKYDCRIEIRAVPKASRFLLYGAGTNPFGSFCAIEALNT
jgi:hypothetical protein